MKRCPSCNRTYTDASLNFCLEDGTPLVSDSGQKADPNATVRYDNRDTNPPKTEIYPSFPSPSSPKSPASPPPAAAAPPSFPPSPRQQWTPPPASLPPVTARKKSSAIWWIVGGVAIVGVIAIGLVVMLIALSSMGSNTNNSNTNSSARVTNRNTNVNANSNRNDANINAAANLPPLVTDDFSEAKWPTGTYEFGEIRYDNDEYHMRSKEGTYLVMYAPSGDYDTGNANVKVTARSVNGTPSSTGFGLIVHGERSKAGELEDYALLIYNGTDPQYEIIKHKGGQQTTLVPWAKSDVIRTGTSKNQLEVRTRGAELSFYINGQYVDKISDTENFKRGLVGLYTSDTTEVAFDDLEIKR